MTTIDLLAATVRSIQALSVLNIDQMADELAKVRQREGRLFIAGSGGGAAHASHACADFRKLCSLEAYCCSDNVAELTARVNDDGWTTSYAEWLRCSLFCEHDALLVISVGGGDFHRHVSPQLVAAVNLARDAEATVLAIVGRDGGHAYRNSDVTVLVPCDVPELVTFVTEGVQSVVLHALAVHPLLAINKAKWEGLTP